MGIDVSAEVTIDRPVEAVATWVMDPANDLSWIRALTDCHRVGDINSGVGLRVSRTARMIGRSMTYVTEVVEVDSRTMKMRTVEGPFPMVVTYAFEGLDSDRTRVVVRNEGGTGIMFSVFGPLIGWMVNSRVKGDLRQMKQVLER